MIWDGVSWVHRDWEEEDWNVDNDWEDECLVGYGEWDGEDGRLPVETVVKRLI